MERTLKEILKEEPGYRLSQCENAIFHDAITSWEQATTIPKGLRKNLNIAFPLDIDASLSSSQNGRTVKALITFPDGIKIETVLMRHKERNTVCVSSQAGCPLKCAFCATGQLGFTRNLTVWEIAVQVLFFVRLLKKEHEYITNIVYMGMGEPFLNYDIVMESIRYLHKKDTLNMGMRRFSVSTSGIPEKILVFANEGTEVNLAFSLHAADNALRSQIMPINKKYPLSEVLKALTYYQKKTNRKLMFEYIMLQGVNDSQTDAEKLVEIAKNYMCVVNLIPFNTSKNIPYKPSKKETIAKFRKALEKAGITVVQRFSHGEDIQAACGQLASKQG